VEDAGVEAVVAAVAEMATAKKIQARLGGAGASSSLAWIFL
jgi:hypothetical protein